MKNNEFDEMEVKLHKTIQDEFKYNLIPANGGDYYQAVMSGDDTDLANMDEFVNKYVNHHAIKRTRSVHEASNAFFSNNKAYLLVNESLNPYDNSDLLRKKRNLNDTSFNPEIVRYFGRALKGIVNHLLPDISFHSYELVYGLHDEIISYEQIILHDNETSFSMYDYEHETVFDLLATLFDDVLIEFNHESNTMYQIT